MKHMVNETLMWQIINHHEQN